LDINLFLFSPSRKPPTIVVLSDLIINRFYQFVECLMLLIIMQSHPIRLILFHLESAILCRYITTAEMMKTLQIESICQAHVFVNFAIPELDWNARQLHIVFAEERKECTASKKYDWLRIVFTFA